MTHQRFYDLSSLLTMRGEPPRVVYPLITVTGDKNIIHTASYTANEIYIKFYSTKFCTPYELRGVVSLPKRANGLK